MPVWNKWTIIQRLTAELTTKYVCRAKQKCNICLRLSMQIFVELTKRITGVEKEAQFPSYMYFITQQPNWAHA